MSKYVYEQFVTPDKLKEMTTDASGVRKGFFGAAKLQSLTPEKRLNVLYSAIRDVEGNENHPIVQALQQHIEKSGVEASVIEDIITTAKQDLEAVSVSIGKAPSSKTETLKKGELQPLEKAVLVDGPEVLHVELTPEELQKRVRELREEEEIDKRIVSSAIKNSEVRDPAELQIVPFNVDNPERSLVLASKLENGKKLTFDEILSKAGVVLNSSDQVLITEAFHKVGIIDRVPKRGGQLSGQIALTVETVVKNNPKLQPFVTEICDAFVDKATQDATRTALNGKFDPLKLQYQQQKKTEIEEEFPSPDTRPQSNALTGRDDPRAPKVEEIEARDSIILGSTTEKGPSKVTVLSSSEVDPITEAIRKEILAEQQKVIKAQIALIDDSVGRMNPQEFREYLTSDKGKEEAAKVFAKPDIQTALNKIEVEGYKKVHTEFSESFKNVNWTPEQITAPGQPKTKTSEITNENGMVVAKIKETTHDIAPLAVTLDNGDQVNVKSYRTIDFPTKLETGKGPLHLSMAVKDQNGRNISEKDAVYFTAHYDEQGKLTEISSPIPVKFMGNDDNAVGYIERNGKVYTLPVTQGKYKEMMKEVAKNQGMSLDLSQEVAKETQDLALTKEKAKASPALEKDEEVIPPKQKSEDLIDLPKVEPLPLQVVDLQGKTAQEKTTAIDDMLRGASPDQIVATLKDQVAKGRSEAVGLIVEATKEGRAGDHRDVPTLTAEQFKEVYETGMNVAKGIADAPANSKTKFMQGLKLNGVQSTCGTLASVAKVDQKAHAQTTSENLTKFNNKHKQLAR